MNFCAHIGPDEDAGAGGISSLENHGDGALPPVGEG
jgi:hypothetical protein